MSKIKSEFFAEAEFQRCDPPCSLQNMRQEFMEIMDEVRRRAGIPLVVTCAYRSAEWDRAKGRSGQSAHTKGLGMDVRANASDTRMKIVKAALELGVSRIGIGKGFVHLDIDNSLPGGVLWHYYDN